MKANRFIQRSLISLGFSRRRGRFAVMGSGKPVVVLQNAEPVSLDPMFTQSDANVDPLDP